MSGVDSCAVLKLSPAQRCFYSMRRCFAAGAVCFLLGAVFAQADFPSLEPVFVFDAAERTLSGEDVIRAGLEFSLCPQDSPQGARVLAVYHELEAAVRADSFRSLAEADRAESVLTLMYERVLTQYVADQSKIDTMFAAGTYNCVSSSVLYFALAKAAGLAVAGQETPDHAFCTVTVDGKRVDVETTNPGGFNPGVRKLVEQTADTTRYFVVPKRYYAGRREVGERKFVSLVGRNLVATMSDRDDYARGVPLAAACLAFTQSADEADANAVRADFDTVAGNYAVVLDQHRSQSERALEWLDAVYARWGASAALQNIYDTVAYNCVANYLNAGDVAQAQRAFAAHKTAVSEKHAAAIAAMIFPRYLEASVQSLSADDAIAFLRAQRNASAAKDRAVAARIDELEAYCWYQKLKPLFDQGDYLAAAALADEGLKSVPGNRNLRTIRSQCYQNYAVDVHNAYAALANAGRYDEALAVVQDGLAVVPANTTLKNDLKRLQSFLQKR